MNKSKKAARDTGTVTGGDGMGTTAGQASFSYSDFITRPAFRQGACAFLGVGVCEAITAAEIATITQMEPRAIRAAFRRARLAGVPVCSGSPGFWLAGSEHELNQCIRGLRRRADAITRAADAMEGRWKP